MHYLYSITNALNNKVYIGQSNKEKERWRQHKYFSKHKPVQYVHFAMSKYGIDNFIYEIIAMCRNQEDADETEMLLIKQYDSRNKEFGYNISPGGDPAWNRGLPKEQQPMYGKKQSKEFCDLMSKIHKGKTVIISTETKQKMSEIRKGKKHSKEWIEKVANANRGKVHRPETIERLRQLSLGRIHTIEAKEKVSRGNKGKKRTDEHKKKYSLAKRKFSDEQEAEIFKLKKSGTTAKLLSKLYNCGMGTIWNIIKRNSNK